MSKTLEFITIDRDGDSTLVVDAKYLALVGMTQDELLEAYGDKAKARKVVLKDQHFGMKRLINKAAQVNDLATGFKLDPDLIPAARAEVVVDNWSFAAPVTKAGFDTLPYLVGEWISAEINAYLYPEAARDQDFFALWTSREKSSEG